ncbi:MAG: site-specific integrase [Devosia sp.]
MRKHNPNNERVKREYLTYLEQAKRMSTSTVDQIAASIALFEASTGYKDFRTFHRNQAIAFKDRLQTTLSKETGRPLAKSTIHSRLMAMKDFVIWLQGRSGFKSRINYGDGEYFNPTANDERIAKAHRQRPVPSLEQLRTAFDAMPGATIIERRDRALFGFAVISGARDNALASFALKHVNLELRSVSQDARDVRTKNAKTFVTNFFPVDARYTEVLAEWIAELRQAGYGPDDPLFPATLVESGSEHRFSATGLKPEFWKSAGAVRRIFKEAFLRAGLPYFNPHSFRNTLAIRGEKICRSAEEWWAYSQNFGHSSPMTTFTSYGKVAPHRQAEILNGLAALSAGQTAAPVKLDEDQVRQLLDQLTRAASAL